MINYIFINAVFLSEFFTSTLAKLGVDYYLISRGYILLLMLYPIMRIGKIAGPIYRFIVTVGLFIITGIIIEISKAYLTIDILLEFVVIFKFVLIFILIKSRSMIYFEKTLINLVKAHIIINLFVICLVYVGGEVAFNIFLPYQVSETAYRIAYSYKEWDNTSWGLFNNQISLAYFALFSFVYLHGNRCAGKFYTITCFLICFLSGSLIATLIFLGYIFFNVINKTNKKLFILIIIIGSLYIPVFFWEGMSIDKYFDLVYLTRGLVFVNTLGAVFQNGISAVLFGLTNDQLIGYFLNPNIEIPISMIDLTSTAPIQDVWILFYFARFGIFGIAMIFAIAYYSLTIAKSRLYKNIIYIILVGSFLNQVLSLTVVSFYLYVIFYLEAAKNAKSSSHST